MDCTSIVDNEAKAVCSGLTSYHLSALSFRAGVYLNPGRPSSG